MNTKTVMYFALGVLAGFAAVHLLRRYGKKDKPCECKEKNVIEGELNLTGPPTCPPGQVPAWYTTRKGTKGWMCVPAQEEGY